MNQAYEVNKVCLVLGYSVAAKRSENSACKENFENIYVSNASIKRTCVYAFREMTFRCSAITTPQADQK